MLDILIVEDNEEIGILLCDFLCKENYTVSVARTGEKALELYEKHAKMTRKHGKMSVIRKKQVKNKKK